MFRMFNKKGGDYKVNKSLWFFLPFLSDKYHDLYNIKGVYLKCDLFENEDSNYKFYLVIYNSSNKNFSSYIDYLTNLSIFEKMKKINENELIFVFTVPHKYKKDYDFFCQSKYSKISDEYKRKIINFFDIRMEGNEYYDEWKHLRAVLFKEKPLKKALEKYLDVVIPEENELSSVLDMERETYEIKKINENDNRDMWENEFR